MTACEAGRYPAAVGGGAEDNTRRPRSANAGAAPVSHGGAGPGAGTHGIGCLAPKTLQAYMPVLLVETSIKQTPWLGVPGYALQHGWQAAPDCGCPSSVLRSPELPSGDASLLDSRFNSHSGRRREIYHHSTSTERSHGTSSS